MTDKVLLVTGGSRGIGARTCQLAAQAGWAVAVNYTANSLAADEVVRAIRAAGGRAMAVQARTLELYRQLGIADAVVAEGHPTLTINLWAKGRRRARLVFGDAGAGVTPYPFVLVHPQDRHFGFG